MEGRGKVGGWWFQRWVGPALTDRYFIFQSTPLHLAAGYNRVNVVKLLLGQDADVHAKDKG